MLQSPAYSYEDKDHVERHLPGASRDIMDVGDRSTALLLAISEI